MAYDVKYRSDLIKVKVGQPTGEHSKNGRHSIRRPAFIREGGRCSRKPLVKDFGSTSSFQLLAHVLKYPRIRLYTEYERPLSDPELVAFRALVQRASEQELKGVLAYTTAANVSIDFNHDPHSATFHMDQTKVIDGSFVRVLSWYDNEWGFSNRMGDTAVAMGKLL